MEINEALDGLSNKAKEEIKNLGIRWDSGDPDLLSKTKKLRDNMNAAQHRAFGGGAVEHQLVDFFRNCDKYSMNTLPPSAMKAGYTFITRPKLCFSDFSLSKREEFISLMTKDGESMQYAIRCCLDTKYAKSNLIKSPLINKQNPFMMPLSNGLIGISGFPDPILNTKTTDSGFHSEDMTYVNGYDMLNKTYDLSLNFRDTQYSPLACLFYFWILYMGYVAKGLMPAYVEDIDRRRLNYTVSIYRFVMDPSMRYIMHYGKATGCFPKSVPFGAFFNMSDSERFIRSAGNFSIPFVCNKMEYNTPSIIMDFNTLVRRYYNRYNTDGEYADIDTAPALSTDPMDNYSGVPFVNATDEVPLSLEFRGKSYASDNDFLSKFYSEVV